ncbi:MAG: c-type cytochrome domain-containing protein [Pirellulaceae bacterium]
MSLHLAQIGKVAQRMTTQLFIGLLLTTCVLTTSRLPAQSVSELSNSDLANRSKELMKQHCYRCHGVEKEVPGLDVLDVAKLKLSRSDEPAYVVAGNPDESLLWQRVGVDKDMPPESVKKRPTEAELAIIKNWIESGAPSALQEQRKTVDEMSIVRLIRNDLQNKKRTDRRHFRYFSMHHSANNSRFDNSDLRMFRAALSKLLNSLARTSLLTLPEVIEGEPLTNDMVYRIDLRDFGWSIDQWQTAISGYPYGLAFNDPDLREITNDVEELVGPVNSDGVPYIRIDWFVATASRPPVYHELAGTPLTAKELEQRLGVDVERDFNQDRLQRAGFASSGVSRHNRLIDRHVGGQTNYYYKSYDFSKSFGRSLLARFPLGPIVESNEFAADFGFQHDGGEMIYSMPNGMQAYMLVDSKGNRINAGPVEIVRDLRETAGTPEIVNGISCIGCHRNGLLDFTNSIDSRLTLTGEERSKVDRLFIDDEEMDRLVASDSERFMNALQQVIGPFLQVEENKEKELRAFPEPVRVVAAWYNRDMTIVDAAAEMNVSDAKSFAASIRTNNELLRMGLGPLAVDQTVPRKMWDTLEESSASVFQRAALAIRVGTGVALSGN